MADWKPLRAGPLTLYFADGDLRSIRLGDIEVLRRIYVAVRDRNWNTIAGRIEGLMVEESADRFSIRYDSVHQQGDVDFRWRAVITGDAAGHIHFVMNGKAHATFQRNRIGFCVHHPLKGCAGQPCTVEKADGTTERGKFPDSVAPHQPFLDFRAVTHEVTPGVEAEVRFSGEVFEMEDHRNWTDANFKTYGTPLRLPLPVEVKAGTEIHQAVEVRLRGTAQQMPPAKAEVVSLRAAAGQGTPMAKLGLCLVPGGELSASDVERLRKLKLSHLRVEAASVGELERALPVAKSLGVPLEVAVTMPAPLGEMKRFSGAVARWLVYGAGEPSASASTVEAARKALGADAKIFGGTNTFFAELNRNRPGGPLDGACFSITPQVHAFDDVSVMENCAGQRDPILTALRFPGVKAMAVSPVTLRMRFNPVAIGPLDPPPPDPRQKEQFCAAWTVGSLKNLLEAGASSVTYFQTNGAGGVMDGGHEYPVFRVFEAVGPFAGGEVIATESSDSSRVEALTLALGKKRRTLVANVGRGPVRVVAPPADLRLMQYGVEIVDWEAE